VNKEGYLMPAKKGQAPPACSISRPRSDDDATIATAEHKYQINKISDQYGGTPMPCRTLIATAALAAALALPLSAAQAFDESKYPDWSGAWRRIPVPGVT